MKIKKIGYEELIFDNGMTLASEHMQDCCEHHYLDFETLESCNIGTATGKTVNIFDQEFDFSNGIKFTRIKGDGINLIDTEGNKYFVAGRSCNNGYYGTNLTVCLYAANGELLYRYDISECQECEREDFEWF